jgi:hypothetical protein
VVALELEDRLDRAIEHARQRQRENPADETSLVALNRMWGWRGDEDARSVVVQALALVRGEQPVERTDGMDPATELAQAGWNLAFPEAARGFALELWRLASEASLKLYGPTPESLGLGRAERIGLKSPSPQWIHVDKIARALGCGGYELYQARDRDACLVAGGALVCGAAFGERMTSVLRFRVAHKLVLLRDRLGPLERLEDEELALFFAACARVAEVGLPPVLQHVQSRADEKAKTVGKILGRKERKALAALGPRFFEMPEPNAWRTAILDGATRLALVVAGDLSAALRELGPSAVRDGRARALTDFALSSEYLALRRSMGLRS